MQPLDRPGVDGENSGELAAPFGQQVTPDLGPGRGGAMASKPMPVMVATAGKGDINVVLTALGNVTPVNNVTVKTRVDGQLVRLAFTEGQTVKAGDLLAEGVPEGVVRAEYCGVAGQARIDWVNPDRGVVDLKTAADLSYFESDTRRYGYAYQLAFYRALLTGAAEHAGSAECLAFCQGTRSVPVYLIGVEKREPFRCGVWRMGEDVLALAEKENREAIERLKRCTETDTWPTGFEQLRTFDWL